MFRNKRILITGGSGMIGRQLIKLLEPHNPIITLADLNKPVNQENIKFSEVDLRDYGSCKNICKNQDYVFNLVGIKCSPKVTKEKPADIMGPMLQFNTNMLEAAMHANVDWYLYTSTVGVYPPAEVFHEDDVWNGAPSKNDWYGGWAKRIGELQCEAYEKQYGQSKCSIVRPANVYGPYDNFDIRSSMVIPSLIRKAHGNKKLHVWGDGSSIRDFIHAEDVARGMIHMVKNKITKPVNLGSGLETTIKKVAEIISNFFDVPLEWDITKPSGDAKRLFDIERAKSYGFEPLVELEDGITQTCEWFVKNIKLIDRKFNAIH